MTTDLAGQEMSELQHLAADGLVVRLPYALRDLDIERRAPEPGKRPMVHWVKTQAGRGYIAPGIETHRPPNGFWGRLGRQMGAITGHLPTTVHAVGPGILVASEWAVPLLDGRLQSLLQLALRADPNHWMLAMLPVIRAQGATIVRDKDQIYMAAGGQIVEGRRALTELVRGDQDDRDGKARQRRWVVALQDLLRKCPDIACEWAREHVPGSLLAAHRAFLFMPAKIPNKGLTAEQEQAWTPILLAAHLDPREAERAARVARDAMNERTPLTWRGNAIANELAKGPLASAIARGLQHRFYEVA